MQEKQINRKKKAKIINCNKIKSVGCTSIHTQKEIRALHAFVTEQDRQKIND